MKERLGETKEDLTMAHFTRAHCSWRQLVCIAAVALGMAAVTLTQGCGHKGHNPVPSSLSGTWDVTSAKVGLENKLQEMPPDISPVGETYFFDADSTGAWVSKDHQLSYTFTYSTAGDTLTIMVGYASTKHWYDCSGKTLVFVDREPFTGIVYNRR